MFRNENNNNRAFHVSVVLELGTRRASYVACPWPRLFTEARNISRGGSNRPNLIYVLAARDLSHHSSSRPLYVILKLIINGKV